MTTLPMKGSKQRGAMMLEALIGILIFSAGILALIGMQALSIAHVADAKYRADASFFANELIAEMWVNRGSLGSYAFAGGATAAPSSGTVLYNWYNRLTAAATGLPGAATNKPVITADATTGYVTIEIRWQPPNATSFHNHKTIALIAAP